MLVGKRYNLVDNPKVQILKAVKQLDSATKAKTWFVGYGFDKILKVWKLRKLDYKVLVV